ncbi:MAG: NUDIX domain-containing protein [Cruoricaptor ignavus]|nr:NUDIX domain-containing protein [Cruoricaptor ignavus]
MIDKINIRVYGVCIKDEKILTLYESYAGERLVKLPGGGLEFGEGTIDCLKREFAEELNLKIKNVRHFYTQEDFLVSKFRANEQLLTIYYLVDLQDETEMKIQDSSIDRAEWLPLDLVENPFPLPIDKLVFEMLKQKLL